jgi:hypothetical protein
MKCYVHRSDDAVGLCRSCGRGVCPDCAAEVGRALACSKRCEDDVRKVADALKRQVEMMRPIGQTFANTATAYRMVRRLLLGIGVLVTFLGGGLSVFEMTRFRPRPVDVALELGLAAIGLLVVVVGSRLPIPRVPPPPSGASTAEQDAADAARPAV